jgi:hypothetical protein
LMRFLRGISLRHLRNLIAMPAISISRENATGNK